MSLFSSLSIGASAINANQFALRIVGNNIANAATEGYVRQEITLGTLDTIRAGSLTFGAGVRAVSVRQQIDRQLNERARQTGGEFEAADAQAALFRRVETTFNELTDNDLSTALSNFFAALQNVANQPDNMSLRSIAVENARVATGAIRDIRTQLDRIVSDINTEVSLAADPINSTLEAIRRLNSSIVAGESGTSSDAGDLRTERDRLLTSLSKLIDIDVHEQPGGSVNILTNGDYLLFNGSIQKVGTLPETVDGQQVTRLVFEGSKIALSTVGGRIGGIQRFRDESIPQVTGALDTMASTLIYQFNRMHSQGQGLRNFSDLVGTYRAIDPSAAMNSADAGLDFVPTNGSFQVRVTDKVTGQVKTYDVDVDLDGIGADDSLNDVVNRINTVAFGGQSVASVNGHGRVELHALAGEEFSFANDSSGFLAAMGLNTFFQGIDSRSIAVNEALAANPALLAASSNGEPGDNGNALRLASFTSNRFDELGGSSFDGFLASMVQQIGSTSQSAAVHAETLKNAKAALDAENLSISGVSLDEEAIKLISYQRGFQASARFLRTINDLMDELMSMIR